MTEDEWLEQDVICLRAHDDVPEYAENGWSISVTLYEPGTNSERRLPMHGSTTFCGMLPERAHQAFADALKAVRQEKTDG